MYSELPSLLHQLHEVVIIIDRGRHGGVEVVPLRLRDSSVVVLIAEVGQELQERLVLRDFSRHHLRVGLDRVAHAQVRGDHTLGTISVELAESNIDDLLAGRVQAASDGSEELVEVDVAVLLGVEVREEGIGLLLSELDSALVEADKELLDINLPVGGAPTVLKTRPRPLIVLGPLSAI